jgi:hypothetical protein
MSKQYLLRSSMILFLPDDNCSLLLPFPTIKAANQQDLADGSHGVAIPTLHLRHHLAPSCRLQWYDWARHCLLAHGTAGSSDAGTYTANTSTCVQRWNVPSKLGTNLGYVPLHSATLKLNLIKKKSPTPSLSPQRNTHPHNQFNYFVRHTGHGAHGMRLGCLEPGLLER